MKKRMLALREKFGEENWLSNHAGTVVQNIMGLSSVSQPVTSPITKLQTLANNISMVSSLHDTLIYMMDNEQSSGELPESQEIAEHAENEEAIPQNEKNTPDELPETHAASSETDAATSSEAVYHPAVSSEAEYDPKEGENFANIFIILNN